MSKINKAQDEFVATLTGMTMSQLTAKYNELADDLDISRVKKFSDKTKARQRLASIHRQWLKGRPEFTEKKVTPKKPKAKKVAKKKVATDKPPRLFSFTTAPREKQKVPKDGTLSSRILETCKDGATIQEVEEVVIAFHKEKGNNGNLKCSTRYFAVRGISNLAKINGFGIRQAIEEGDVIITVYV